MMKPYEGPKHSVVGFTLRDGLTEVLHAGTTAATAPAADWIFEIGSITKVFTAILLCVLVEEGEVDPQAPLSEMSADLSVVPNWITPESLTTHTSGLPDFHLPLRKVLFSPLQQNPYASFNRSDLLSWFQKLVRQKSGHQAPTRLFQSGGGVAWRSNGYEDRRVVS